MNEKKAIELLKTYENKLVYEISEKDKEAVKVVLHYIEKLKQENKELKHITQNYNSYQQKSDNPISTIIIADEKWFIKGYFKENFIPKSKVKEKIKEVFDILDTKPYTAYTLYGDELFDSSDIEEVLQELLESEE